MDSIWSAVPPAMFYFSINKSVEETIALCELYNARKLKPDNYSIELGSKES